MSVSSAQVSDERRVSEEEETTNEEVLASLESQEETPEEETQEETLPEKYQGKSLEDVVRMHQEAEKALGRQSSEVGELRKVVDDYIAAQPVRNEVVQEQQHEEVDYWTDPQAAVNHAIANHPKIKEAEAVTQRFQKETALANLQQRHPDMNQILNDEAFVSWVKASNYRTKMFVEADQRFDYEAADELFSLWKEKTKTAETAVAVEKQARKKTVKTANTGNARGTANQGRKKVYRRADIIRLMKDDPERYQALSSEIFQAYAEGRVK